MAISSNLAVTSDVDGYTLAELLDLLGSPKAVKTALADIEKAARKNTKALKDINAAEMDRKAATDAANAKREKEIAAIHRDNDALVAAWKKLEDDTAIHNANNNKAKQNLRKEQGEFKGQEQGVAYSLALIAKERDALDAARAGLEETIAGEKVLLEQERQAAAKDRADAKRMLDEAKDRMKAMRDLVG